MDGLFDTPMPMGLGMALAQNEGAMKMYCRLTGAQKDSVIKSAKSVTSKQEMRALVQQLEKGTIFN